MFKIGLSWDRLIFNMVNTIFYIDTPPWHRERSADLKASYVVYGHMSPIFGGPFLITVTSWYSKTPVTRPFVQNLVWADNKENTKPRNFDASWG